MSLYQQILTVLSGAPIQNQRMLRLTTPLGAEVLLAERVDLEEHIGPVPQARGAGLHAVVHALAADSHIELKTMLGQPALLQLELADGTHRPWHGHITQAELLGSDGGLARYRLTIEPWLAFLAHRQDSWVFQGQTVMEIVEEVFADYSNQGRLVPAWRWELADLATYAQRSLCIQYQETDLAFIQRLLREEGLFYWWEHQTQDGDSLGRHTLVIADHNAAFRPNPQPRVRYTQAGLALKTDSLTRWRNTAAVHTARIEQASQDYRSNGATPALREQSQTGQNLPAGMVNLSLTDTPGLYAYEDSAQGQRLVLRQMQALDAQRHQARASGTLRQAAPGSTLTLLDHPVHDGTDPARDEHVVLAVHHRARNNLRADHQAQVLSLLGAIAKDQIKGDIQAQPGNPNDTDEPVYSSTLQLQPAAAPVRMAGGMAGQPDVRLHPRPTIHGVQTAIVVGGGEGGAEPIHTDRDHRIKIQFHWQRGANSSHRLNPPAGDNAPASPASGSWVRVSQAWAGANWGANFIPRVGQEVLIGFIQGDIDRPVVMGTVYNGQGQADAQSNQQSAGAANASGDAPAWFPGSQTSGKHQGHQHPQVLAGHKSQELATSAQGSGGYNQLVFDDSPGQGRIEVSSSSAQTRMQLGHLLHQTDNQRLNPRGHGADLATAAWGAVRAGSGLLISAHGRPGGSLGNSMQIDTREPQTQLDQGRELIHTLAETAQKHNAKLGIEPDVVGATEKQRAKQLPVEQGFFSAVASLVALSKLGAPAADESGAEGGENSEEAPAPSQQFDEQLQFVNAKGAKLTHVKYEVLLADGSKVGGVTDEEGRTRRILTDAAQAVQQVTLQPRSLDSCCASHAELSEGTGEPLTFSPQGAATNPQNVGQSIQQVTTPEGKARGLTAGEIAMARLVFKDSIDYGKVMVHNGEYLWFGLQPNDTAMTPNGEMYFNPDQFLEDFSKAIRDGTRHWFMHEMVHVWQYQLGYPVELRGAIRLGLSYEYVLATDKRLSDYNMEAQGDVLADYFVLKYMNAPSAMRQSKYAASLVLYESSALSLFLQSPSDKRNLPGGN